MNNFLIFGVAVEVAACGTYVVLVYLTIPGYTEIHLHTRTVVNNPKSSPVFLTLV